jgi:hypothetical protein
MLHRTICDSSLSRVSSNCGYLLRKRIQGEVISISNHPSVYVFLSDFQGSIRRDLLTICDARIRQENVVLSDSHVQFSYLGLCPGEDRCSCDKDYVVPR